MLKRGRPMQQKSGYCLLLASALAISACAKKESVAPLPTPSDAPAPAPAVSHGTTREALDLMGMGAEEQARAILEGILQRNPGDRIAKKYLDQIVVDPKQLLGEQSYRYKVQSGDTMASIARARMGDSTLFYALSRYNGISDPRRINAGQTIRIPGVEPKPAVTKARPPASPPETADKEPQTPAVDAGQAKRLRAAGLAALNRGSVSRAVNLLAQANRLDPSNQAIAADLARARRIQKTVAD